MESTKQLTILLVDDKPSNIYALQELLASADRNLLVAHNGNEALKVALHTDTDLILLDVHMPDMDGFEVARVLKLNKRTKNIPIVFVTAEKKERYSVMKGLEGGAIDYLFKPLDPEITKAKVDVLLNLQRQKNELMEKNLALQKADKHIQELNHELEKNLADLKLANKELEAFSYSISHDLRSPLRALNAYSNIMMEDYMDKLDEEGKKVLGTIANNAKKMSLMVDNLLEFSRLGRRDLKRIKFNMDELVENCIKEIDTEGKDAASITRIPMQTAIGDPSLLSHVWINLLSNAIKYSAKMSEPEVEIGAYHDKGKMVYFVKDNGVGFDMAYADKLFGVFQRLHSVQEFQGIGIGLAIVHKIISKHGGDVWAEGKVDKGATFYFSLPEK